VPNKDEIVTMLALGVIGVEGIVIGLESNGMEGIGAEGIRAGVVGDRDVWLCETGLDGINPERSGAEGTSPTEFACDGAGADGISADLATEGIKPEPPSTAGA
jgi:hypothetical protein